MTGIRELLSGNDTIKSPLKERLGFDFLWVMKTNRRERFDTEGGGRLQERGGGEVTNVL